MKRKKKKRKKRKKHPQRNTHPDLWVAAPHGLDQVTYNHAATVFGKRISRWAQPWPSSVRFPLPTIRSRRSCWRSGSHPVGTRLLALIEGKVPTKQISAHRGSFACKDLGVKDWLRLVFSPIDTHSACESGGVLVGLVMWVRPATTSAKTYERKQRQYKALGLESRLVEINKLYAANMLDWKMNSKEYNKPTWEI